MTRDGWGKDCRCTMLRQEKLIISRRAADATSSFLETPHPPPTPPPPGSTAVCRQPGPLCLSGRANSSRPDDEELRRAERRMLNGSAGPEPHQKLSPSRGQENDSAISTVGFYLDFTPSRGLTGTSGGFRNHCRGLSRFIWPLRRQGNVFIHPWKRWRYKILCLVPARSVDCW